MEGVIEVLIGHDATIGLLPGAIMHPGNRLGIVRSGKADFNHFKHV